MSLVHFPRDVLLHIGLREPMAIAGNLRLSCKQLYEIFNGMEFWRFAALFKYPLINPAKYSCKTHEEEKTLFKTTLSAGKALQSGALKGTDANQECRKAVFFEYLTQWAAVLESFSIKFDAGDADGAIQSLKEKQTLADIDMPELKEFNAAIEKFAECTPFEPKTLITFANDESCEKPCLNFLVVSWKEVIHTYLKALRTNSELVPALQALEPSDPTAVIDLSKY